MNLLVSGPKCDMAPWAKSLAVKQHFSNAYAGLVVRGGISIVASK